MILNITISLLEYVDECVVVDRMSLERFQLLSYGTHGHFDLSTVTFRSRFVLELVNGHYTLLPAVHKKSRNDPENGKFPSSRPI